MKDIFEIKDIEQLKAISDPLRIKIIWEIVESAQTGKMIADTLELPASKVHYHLKELERVGIVVVEKTEEKNGIIQKFYRLIAYQLKIDASMLPHSDLVTDSLRWSIISSLEHSKSIVSKAEDAIFEKNPVRKDSLQNSIAANVYLTEDQITWLKEVMDKLITMIRQPGSDNTDNKQGKKHHLNWLVVPMEKDEEQDREANP